MTLQLRLTCTLAVIALYGCVFENADIYRPLHRHTVPDSSTVLPVLANAYPGTPQAKIEKSLKQLRFSRFNFGVFVGYQDWANFLSFEDLDNSLKSFPDNPFAWSLLGNYLSLEKQPAAASIAAERSIQIVTETRQLQGQPLGNDLTTLRWTTEVNRAIFLNQEGEFAESTRQLDALMSESIAEPFVQLAITWTRCVALIGNGSPAQALQILDSESTQFRSKLPDTVLFESRDYPQYFKENKRRAIFDFLRGEAFLRLGKSEEAKSALRSSVKADPHLWVAQLTLGTALYGQGDLKGATKVLEALVRHKPTHSLYSYDLARFNLGTLYLEQGRIAQAIHNFEEVVDTAEKHDRLFEKKIAPHLPAEILASIVRTSDGRVVSEAYNNLGTSVLRAALDKGKDQPKAADAAIEYYAKVQSAETSVTIANVARAKWYSGDQTSAIRLLASVVRKDKTDESARESLLQFGLRTDDPELTYTAFETYLDTVTMKSASLDTATLKNIQSSASVLLPRDKANIIARKVNDLLSQK